MVIFLLIQIRIWDMTEWSFWLANLRYFDLLTKSFVSYYSFAIHFKINPNTTCDCSQNFNFIKAFRMIQSLIHLSS